MKKLLNLLSVLTISGTAVPTTIAASPYKKEEIKLENSAINYLEKKDNNLNRSKREFNYNHSELETYEPAFSSETLYFSLLPNFFEEVIKLYYSSNGKNDFLLNLKNKMLNIYIKTTTTSITHYLEKYLEGFWNNWQEIEDLWKKSDRNKRIRIVVKWGSFESVNIITDEDFRQNIYFLNLKNDFKNDFKNDSINLGLIANENDSSILSKIKEIYPNLDVSQIEIIDKHGYSYFSKGFYAKIKVKNNSWKYSINALNNKIVFNTEENIKKISNIFNSDEKTKQWLEHIKDWNERINYQIRENVPTFTRAQKNTWKDDKVEQLKTYIRDWGYVLNLIEHEQKLEELDKSVKGIREDIDKLKLEINKINNIVLSINHNSTSGTNLLTNCSNIGGLVAATTAPIPYIGIVISLLSGTLAAVCAIANT